MAMVCLTVVAALVKSLWGKVGCGFEAQFKDSGP
jgi:hypothetical protein